MVSDEREYTYRGVVYRILDTDPYDEGRCVGLLRDFKYCESVGDWSTLENRIESGKVHGWIQEGTRE